MKLYKLILLIIGIGIICYFCGGYFNKEIVYKQVEKEVVLDNLIGKINQLKGEIINDIFMSENGGNKEDDVLITYDPNPRNKKVQIASVGNCQFKLSTIQYYEKQLYNKDLTRKEALMIAISDEKCKELMTDIIFKYKDGWQEWYNSGKKINASDRLSIIRELEN